MSFQSKGKLAIIQPEKIKRIIVAGDLHGDFSSLRKIIKIFNPNEDLIIFLGDYADRGEKGVEVIEEIKNLMKEHSKKVIALKGNHEDYFDYGEPKFSPCTLIQEVERKIGSWNLYFKNFKKDFLDKLYIAAEIQNYALFVHAGVSRKVKSEKDLINPSKDVEEDLIWSDPFDEEGEYPNPRGAGILYGKDVSKEVCERLNVKFIIRSHEPMKALSNPFVEHDGRVITISSTSVYGGRPFVLILPAKNFPESKEIEKYVAFL
jgi:predicted phosphodiesterase